VFDRFRWEIDVRRLVLDKINDNSPKWGRKKKILRAATVPPDLLQRLCFFPCRGRELNVTQPTRVCLSADVGLGTSGHGAALSSSHYTTS